MGRAHLAVAMALASLVLGSSCGGRREGPGPAVGTSTVSTAASPSAPPESFGPPLDFVLDPLEKETEPRPESEVLRGKRAVILLIASFDLDSQAALRVLAPSLRELPPDTQCLLVALQSLGDRPLIRAFMDGEPTPCRRAVGDATRGRLGDLGKVKIVPTLVVLRADGRVAGARSGEFDETTLKSFLEKAR